MFLLVGGLFPFHSIVDLKNKLSSAGRVMQCSACSYMCACMQGFIIDVFCADEVMWTSHMNIIAQVIPLL